MPYVVGRVMLFNGRDVQPGDILTDEEARAGNLHVLLKSRRLYLQGTEPERLKAPQAESTQPAAALSPTPSRPEDPAPKPKKKKHKSFLSKG